MNQIIKMKTINFTELVRQNTHYNCHQMHNLI